MLKVGLTGSIATGKSFVMEQLRIRGCHTLDADLTAREAVERGSEGLERIVAEFGLSVLQPDGALDRQKMGELIFKDDVLRQKLNAIVHPLVIEAQDKWLRSFAGEQGAIAVIEAALMIESGGYKHFDDLIVVWCSPDIQLARLMARNGLIEAEAKRRIDSQMPQHEKKRFADHLVDTSDGYERTVEQVEAIFEVLSSKADR
jgi:dephospho-CoA kinase